MRVATTLNLYLARNYFLNLLFMLAVLLSLIYLFDTVELHRRAGKHNGVPILLVLKMGLLKLPEVGQLVFPFAILFSAMFTFWQLTRRYELIVMRASGFSVWQFLAPVIGVAVFIGIFQVSVMNPMGAMLLTKFERMEHDYLSPQKNLVSLSKDGLWLRQPMDQGHVIIHARSVSTAGWVLNNAMVLFFTPDDGFIQRLDAAKAKLSDGKWVFLSATLHVAHELSKPISSFTLNTDLTIKEIEDSFASPETMSFWNLPGFIATMEATGFDATRLKIYFQSLLSQPFLFAAMILLAASVSLRPPRDRGAFTMVIMGVILGFVVFFLSSFLQALGASHQIPVLLASWTPALVTSLLGVAIMLNMEDG